MPHNGPVSKKESLSAISLMARLMSKVVVRLRGINVSSSSSRRVTGSVEGATGGIPEGEDQSPWPQAAVGLDTGLDAKAKVQITADGGWRRGQVLPLKATVDDALRYMHEGFAKLKKQL